MTAIALIFTALAALRVRASHRPIEWEKLTAVEQARVLAAEKQRVRELWRGPSAESGSLL